MNPAANRFETFFESPGYTGLKNLLYNYRLRKRAVTRRLQGASGLTVEVGSGISPMLTGNGPVVYTDLSLAALSGLRRARPGGMYVVADAGCLPFLSGAFENAVCSEVIEHLKDDGPCLEELQRVLVEGGRLVLTFPHRRCYFANDDRYVSHYRRYELEKIEKQLEAAGFRSLEVEKVLGPLEKLTMMTVTGVIAWVQRRGPRRWRQTGSRPVPGWLHGLFDLCNRLYAGLIWLDAKAMPRAAASVLLVASQKR